MKRWLAVWVAALFLSFSVPAWALSPSLLPEEVRQSAVPGTPAATEKPETKTPAQSQFERRLNVQPVTVEEFAQKANAVTGKVWLLAQAYSMPMVLISVIAGALFMVLGAFMGRKMVAGGFTIILVGLLAFVLINFAPEIIGLAQGVGRSFLK